ncbi:MAG: hypothetical protein ABIG89_04055 [Candidatus Woesearchaeota archaeon]
MGLRKTFLAIGIAIIFALFIGYGIYTVYEPPNDYGVGEDCYYKFSCDEIFNCSKAISLELSEPSGGDSETKPVVKPISEERDNECYQKQYLSKEYHQCQEQVDKCREEAQLGSPLYFHARNSFFALIIIAMTSIFVGINLKHLEGIGSGFLGGGILIILWSLPYTATYWWNWNKYVKLAALGLILVLLVYLGYKKLETKQ